MSVKCIIERAMSTSLLYCKLGSTHVSQNLSHSSIRESLFRYED